MCRVKVKALMSCLIGMKLMACQTVPSDVPDAGTNASELLAPLNAKSSKIYTTTETFTFDQRKSPAWISDTFDGSHSRFVNGETLSFAVVQKHEEGGLDVGFEDTDVFARPVSQIPVGLMVCSSYDIDLKGDGRWWAGPKISVNWQGDETAKQNGDDWYENYIIEIASSSPQTLHDIFMGDYFKAQVLPKTTLAGSNYRHYKIRFHSWWQFWSVRQNYRENGVVPIKPILDIWAANGLPTDRQLDGIKANIETYGQLQGTGRLKIDASSNPVASLECAI